MRLANRITEGSSQKPCKQTLCSKFLFAVEKSLCVIHIRIAHIQPGDPFPVNDSFSRMYSIGSHLHLESQSRNSALVFACILMVFGTFASISRRRVEAMITEPTGNSAPSGSRLVPILPTFTHCSEYVRERLVGLPCCRCLTPAYV